MVFCNNEITYNIEFNCFVTILILIDGFLQYVVTKTLERTTNVTILILIDGFLQYSDYWDNKACSEVTILILIDGFLQCELGAMSKIKVSCHNPYFNRWFSAIPKWK